MKSSDHSTFLNFNDGKLAGNIMSVDLFILGMWWGSKFQHCSLQNRTSYGREHLFLRERIQAEGFLVIVEKKLPWIG